jgi:hypothetical protein
MVQLENLASEAAGVVILTNTSENIDYPVQNILQGYLLVHVER